MSNVRLFSFLFLQRKALQGTSRSPEQQHDPVPAETRLGLPTGAQQRHFIRYGHDGSSRSSGKLFDSVLVLKLIYIVCFF